MKRVLVLGGYGVFGHEVSERLAELGFEVIVAGRKLANATAFCAGRPRLIPAALNRDGDLTASFLHWRPWAVVDAAGPFQDLSYKVAAACIARGAHYIDIADARHFVTNIAQLDEAAKTAHVSVISGASSVPALTGAVARELAADMDCVNAVEISISASNRASVGRSVISAITSYIGQPLRIWRGGCWEIVRGWRELRRETYAMEGSQPLKNRLVAIADVPDLEILPSRLPGEPSVTFRAGTEFAFHNIGLWLLSWVVQWLRLKKLRILTPVFYYMQKLTLKWGGERSAMMVSAYGHRKGLRIEKRWTLIADRSHGRRIPAMAAPLIVHMLARGGIGYGAADAGALLTLAEYNQAWNGLEIVHQVNEVRLPPALYQRVMGPDFLSLSPAIRHLHEVLCDSGATGRASIIRGRNVLARIIASVFGFPSEGMNVAVHVSLQERNGVETWTRNFAGKRFKSRLFHNGTHLVESFGPFRFMFELIRSGGELHMGLRGWSFMGLPLPHCLCPRSNAREWEEQGLFHFDVPISMPLIGLIVHYRGWLVVKGRK